MPAAAVIPAPIAYIKVVAVKTPLLRFEVQASGPARAGSLFVFSCPTVCRLSPAWCSSLSVPGGRRVYFEKIRVFKAGFTA